MYCNNLNNLFDQNIIKGRFEQCLTDPNNWVSFAQCTVGVSDMAYLRSDFASAADRSYTLLRLPPANILEVYISLKLKISAKHELANEAFTARHRLFNVVRRAQYNTSPAYARFLRNNPSINMRSHRDVGPPDVLVAVLIASSGVFNWAKIGLSRRAKKAVYLALDTLQLQATYV